jgi:uncharacterized membrane protein
MEKQLRENMAGREQLVAKNVAKLHEEAKTFGDQLADRLAQVAGSWGFIIGFIVVLLAWIALNTYMLITAKPFDPYPFMALNLVLSCLAAIQAPVIMMSQNRQADHDRIQDTQDYETNVKAEQEIENVFQQLDAHRKEDTAQLMALQEQQMKLLQDILTACQRGSSPSQ